MTIFFIFSVDVVKSFRVWLMKAGESEMMLAGSFSIEAKGSCWLPEIKPVRGHGFKSWSRDY